MIVEFFTEGIREPRHAAHPHTDAEILPFDV